MNHLPSSHLTINCNSSPASLRKFQFEQTVQHKHYTHEHVQTCSINSIAYKQTVRHNHNTTERAQSCSVNTIIIQPLTAEGHKAFHGIARMQRDLPKRSQEPKTLSVLMDPGAEINLIRGDLLNATKKYSALKIHATASQNIELTNNGKVIGHVREAVYLSFVLDTVPGVATQLYHEWFHVFPELTEELALGAAFCRQQCFTSFHTRLQPWRKQQSDKSKQTAKRSNLAMVGVQRAETIASEFEPPANPLVGGSTRGGESYNTDINDVLWDTALQRESAGSNNLKRTRERVETPCERIDAHAAKHSNAPPLFESTPVAGRRLRAKSANTPAPQPKSHTTHVPWSRIPVQYNQTQTRQIAQLLARRTIDEQKALYKSLQQLGQRNAPLTMEEAETLRDTARLCASEAEKTFTRTQQLRNNYLTLKRTKTFRPSG